MKISGNILTFIQDTAPVIRQVGFYTAVAVICFVAGIWMGVEKPDDYQQLQHYLENLAGFLKERNVLTIILFLFLKNALTVFIVLWLGTAFGIVPLIAAVENGIVLGSLISQQDSPLLSLLNIIPHGIFELPAFFLACGIGLWRGWWLFRRDKNELYKERAQKGYRVFFRLIVPLLIIAAVIEGSLINLIR